MNITPTWLASTLCCVSVLLGQQTFGQEYRTINGFNNNLTNPTFGEAETELLRLAPNAYADGISTPTGGAINSSLPSARAISNAVSAQPSLTPNSLGASDWVWQWGQFLDHDLDLSGGAPVAEPFDISVPTGDSFFDPKFGLSTQRGTKRSFQ